MWSNTALFIFFLYSQLILLKIIIIWAFIAKSMHVEGGTDSFSIIRDYQGHWRRYTYSGGSSLCGLWLLLWNSSPFIISWGHFLNLYIHLDFGHQVRSYQVRLWIIHADDERGAAFIPGCSKSRIQSLLSLYFHSYRLEPSFYIEFVYLWLNLCNNNVA